MVQIHYARYAEDRIEFQDKYDYDPVRRRTVALCRNCGKPRQGRFHFYCSAKCREKFIKDYAPHGWAYFRDMVLKRDGNRCTKCGALDSGPWVIRGVSHPEFPQPLEVDHIKPVALYPDLEYDMANCRTLCHDCHVKLGKKPTNARRTRRQLQGVAKLDSQESYP